MAATSVTGTGNGAALQDTQRHKLDMGGNNLNMSGGSVHQMALTTEDVTASATAGAGALSLHSVVSFCTTASSAGNVTLADGIVVGQLKYVVLKTKVSADLVLTPDSFGAGATVTFAIAGNGVHLVWDGTNWNLLTMDESTNAITVA